MDTTRLGKVAHINMGSAPSGQSYNTIGEGLPMIAGAGDYGEKFPEPKKWTTAPTRVTEIGDLIVCVRATIGDLNWADKKYCLGRGVAGVRPKKEMLDINFAAQYLNAKKNDLAQLGTGSTFPAIRRADLENFPMPLPPLVEQKRIAAILDKADAIRSKRRHAIQFGDEFLRSVFLDMFGGPTRNPKKWKKGHIQDLCKDIIDCPHATPRYTASQTDFACIRSSDIQNCYMDWSSTKYVDEVEYKKRIRRLEPVANDVIYCREGARFGNAARIPKGKTVCLGQRMMLFRSNQMVSTAEFIWSLLNSNSVYQQAVQRIGGSASPHINVKDIKKFIIFIPPLSIQQNYTAIVRKVDAKKENFQKSSLRSEQLFNSISQRAFRGEL